MSYIDAYHDPSSGRVHVVERDEAGNRIYKSFPVNYTFYYTDTRSNTGWHSIYGNPVAAMTFETQDKYKKELRAMSNYQLWEVGVRPVNKVLSEHYQGILPPKPHVAFLDIESDWCNERGFAPVDDPFNQITAITLYLDWSDQLITLAIPPKSLSKDTAAKIANQFDNTFVFETEKEMLDMFLTLIDDADILSGWNSEKYDLPYIIGRIERKLSRADARRLCLWGKAPMRKKFTQFGAEHFKYELTGRVSLDYMHLYKKYTTHELQSFSLNFVAEYELGDQKTEYQGTLDQLYNTDFARFIEYNRQDVDLLRKLEEKLNFMGLANIIAHENTVLLPAVLGTVAVTEQAIYNYAHANNMVIPSRKVDYTKTKDRFSDNTDNEDDRYDIPDVSLYDEDGDKFLFDDTQAAGAYVANPKKGVHQYVGAVDINSLYPSTFRALNISPETLIGQVKLDTTNSYIQSRMKKSKKITFAAAWEGLFGTLEYQAIMKQDPHFTVTIDWENGWDSVTCSAKDAYDLIFCSGQPWIITANGTIFDNSKKGLIPSIFEIWYAARKSQQKKKKDYSKLLAGIEIPNRLK